MGSILYSIISNPNILFHFPLRAQSTELTTLLWYIDAMTRVVMRSCSHLVLGWWRGPEAGPGRGWRGWAACWSRCGLTAAAGGLLGLLTAHMYVCCCWPVPHNTPHMLLCTSGGRSSDTYCQDRDNLTPVKFWKTSKCELHIERCTCTCKQHTHCWSIWPQSLCQ